MFEENLRGRKWTWRQYAFRDISTLAGRRQEQQSYNNYWLNKRKMEDSLVPQPPLVGGVIIILIFNNCGEQFSKIQPMLIFKV